MGRNITLSSVFKPVPFLFALLLALAALCPVCAHAEEGWIEVSSAAQLNDALLTGGNIKLTDDIAVPSGSPLSVEKDTTIDLNGHTINRGLTSATRDGYVIGVKGKLTVQDGLGGGKITGGWNISGFGGCIYVFDQASFTLASGSITENVVSIANGFGGGVYVDSGATFTMTGGEISYCSAGSSDNNSQGIGGGVAVAGTFEMTGGFIYKCGILSINNKNSTTAYGGAVAVIEGGSFILDGGVLGQDETDNPLGNQALLQGGCVYVQKHEANASDTSAENTFSFSSGSIVSGYASGGGAGAVYNGDTFTMSGSQATIRNTTSGNAVITDRNSIFTMSAGVIRNNSSTGVIVEKGGAFNMEGGAIRENTGAFGGGVRVNGGTFKMSSGAIVENTATCAGGGVYISPNSTNPDFDGNGIFNMTGGNIALNKVAQHHDSATLGYGNGGGVWIGNGTFNMAGGYIVNNQSALEGADSVNGHAALGGGVWVGNNATFAVSGNPIIQSNKVGNSLFISNVKLDADARINIDDELAGAAQIGITPFVSTGADWGNTAIGAFGFKQGPHDNIFSYNPVSQEPSYNFISDIEDYKVVRHSDDNYAQLLYHEHDITYTSHDNSLIAECSGCGETAQLLLIAENGVDDGSTKVYFGSGITAFNKLTKKNVTNNDIEYNKDGSWSGAAPTEVGTYNVRYIFTDGPDNRVIENTYTIEHDWDEWVETVQPTFDTAGKKTRTCHNCGATEEETIPKLPFVTVTLVGSAIDASVAEDLVIRITPGSSVGDIFQDRAEKSRAQIVDHFSQVSGYLPYQGELMVATKPIAEFNSWDDVWADVNNYFSQEINEDKTLYVALAKPVTEINLSVAAPLCGTEVVYDYQGVNEGKPVITLVENGQVTMPKNQDTAALYPRWIDGDENPLRSLRIEGGNTYTAGATVDAAFGYQFDNNATPTLGVEGAEGSAEFIQNPLDPDFSPDKVFKFNVKAVHDWNEGIIDPKPTCVLQGTKTISCKHNGEAWHDPDAIFSTEQLPVDPNAHDWEFIGFTWTGNDADGYTKAVASYQCKNEPSHARSLDASLQSTTIDPSCIAGGRTTYTALVEADQSLDGIQHTDSKTHDLEIDPNNHDWAEPVYEWNGDYSSVTARRFCKNDASHEEHETVGTTSKITKEASEDNDGIKTYTSKNFANPAFAVQIKTETIPAIGHEHDWGAPTYTWTKDKSQATATRTCKKNSNHVETETVAALSAITKNPTCTQMGERTYTAVFNNVAFATQTVKEAIDAKGHTAGNPVKENEVAASCETAGSYDEVVYCTVCGDEISREAKTIDAVGHDWGNWIVTTKPTVNSEGVETRTCARCGKTETRKIPKLDPNPAPEPKPGPNPNPGAISYSNSTGDGNVWTKGSSVTSDFTFKRSESDAATFDHFIGIQVDGQDVDKSNYIAESGSVIVKLRPEYLETLALGKHTLIALFDDGNSASANFTVVTKGTAPAASTSSSKQAAAKPTSKIANTADNVPIAFLGALALLALVMVVAARIKRA